MEVALGVPSQRRGKTKAVKEFALRTDRLEPRIMASLALGKSDAYLHEAFPRPAVVGKVGWRNGVCLGGLR